MNLPLAKMSNLMEVAIPLVCTVVGIVVMRRELQPVAVALTTPRTPGLVYAIAVGTPALPPVAMESRLDQEGLGWVVIGRSTAADSDRIARSAMAYSGVAVRCTIANRACEAVTASDEPEVNLCWVGKQIRHLPRCGTHACKRVTLLWFFQEYSQTDERRLRASCREEADRWLAWNPETEERR